MDTPAVVSLCQVAAACNRERARLLFSSAVGEKTFGKGRTQRIIPLQDGSELLLSNAQYLTPSGDSVDGVGISPDQICVPEVRGGVTIWQNAASAWWLAPLDAMHLQPCRRCCRCVTIGPVSHLLLSPG